MKNPTLFSFRVRQGDRRGEVAIVRHPAVAAKPLVVPLPSVHHGPGDDGVVLAVGRVTPGTFLGHASADAFVFVAVLEFVRYGAIFHPKTRFRWFFL